MSAQFVDVRTSRRPDRLLRDERAARVRAAIAQLPRKQRATLILRMYHEMSHQEIADVLGSSVGAVKANFFHALANLKKLLGDGRSVNASERRATRRPRRRRARGIVGAAPGVVCGLPAQLARAARDDGGVAEVEVPEPSPLFWDHLSARVRDAVAAEPARRWWSGVRSWPRWLMPAASPRCRDAPRRTPGQRPWTCAEVKDGFTPAATAIAADVLPSRELLSETGALDRRSVA